MTSFVCAKEIWVPNLARTELELLQGSYGDFTDLREVSLNKKFAFGAGLPGMAWAAAHPILATSESGDFQRSAVARANGISSALALPIFAGDFLAAVVVLMLGSASDHIGAFEVWHCNTLQSYDLKLVAGYFGQLQHFEVTARHTSFRQGTGLPGRAWEDGLPVLMKDLGHSHAFVRHEGALRAGISTGLAFPVFHDPAQIYIVAILSSNASPVARQIEVWDRDPTGPGMIFRSGESVWGDDLEEHYLKTQIGPREGLIGRSFFSGVPGLSDDLRRDTSVNPERGLSTALAIPIIKGGKCYSMVVLYD